MFGHGGGQEIFRPTGNPLGSQALSLITILIISSVARFEIFMAITGGAFSSGVKRSGRDADHSPPSSAEIKKT
jgi:hypothetical protein